MFLIPLQPSVYTIALLSFVAEYTPQLLNLSKAFTVNRVGGSHPDITEESAQDVKNAMVEENKALNCRKSIYTIEYGQLTAWCEAAKNRTFDI